MKILFDMRWNKFNNKSDLEIDLHSVLTLGAGALALGFESRTMFLFSGCREGRVLGFFFWELPLFLGSNSAVKTAKGMALETEILSGVGRPPLWLRVEVLRFNSIHTYSQ